MVFYYLIYSSFFVKFLEFRVFKYDAFVLEAQVREKFSCQIIVY